QLLFGEPRMRFGRVIAPAPEDEPQQAERAGDEERRAPAAELRVEERDQRDRDRGAEGRPAVEKRHRPSPLAAREPLRHRLRRAGPVRRLARAEEETERAEAPQPPGE